MQCPKDKNQDLLEGNLAGGSLLANHCPECEGSWISAEVYQAWQARQLQQPASPQLLTKRIDVNFTASPFDMKAALCPECQHYLSRVKVHFKTPFYIERCMHCGGIWCDKGEWEVLEKLGLHTTIEQMFSSEWQLRARELEQLEKERQATIEKLGEELAEQVFQLAEVLEKHPAGDFGVAYLIRRVIGTETGNPQ